MKKISNARESLLAEGRRVLSESGYAELDIKKVAAASGMATGTFYNYFLGKKEFVLAIAADELDKRQAEAERIIARYLPLEDTLEQVVSVFRSYREEIDSIFWQIPLEPGESLDIMANSAMDARGLAARIMDRTLATTPRITGVGADDIVSFVAQYFTSVATVGAMPFPMFLTCLNALLGNETKKPAAAVEDAKLMVWDYDIVNHRVTMSDNDFDWYDYDRFGLTRVVENAPQALVPFIVDGYVDAFLDMYRKIDEGAPKAFCEVWYRLEPEQQPRCMRISFTNFFDETGKPVRAFGIGQNVTFEKSAEMRYEQAFRELAQAHPHTLGSFHLNLTRNWAGEGSSPLDFVLKQQESGTVDGYFAEFAKLIADDKLREWYFTVFDRKKLLDGFNEGRHEVSFEYPIIYEDGSRHWREGLLYLMQNPATGDIEGVTYAIDIDERKCSEMIARALSREVFDFMILVDMQTGRIILGGTTSESSTEEYRNVDYRSAMVEALEELMPPEGLDKAIAAHELGYIREQLETQRIFELTLTTGDGSYLHWRFTYADEERTVILITREDITLATYEEQERVCALDEERRAHQHTSALLQSILDCAPVAMFWKDVDRRFEGANRAFLDFYGFDSLDEIRGKNDEEMGWHPDPGPYRDDELQVIAQGISTRRVPGECMSHGKLCHIVASKSPRYENGKVVGLVGNFEDVTREFEHAAQITALNADLREALTNAEQASAAEQTFLSNMSHDMRTPLNGIIGFTNLALRSDSADKRQGYLEKIDVSGKLMLDLVNDVLDLSKIESGKMELRREAFESSGLFDAIIDAVQLSAEARGIRLDCKIDATYPRFILADRLRCQQVALNLLSNAIKYTPDGGTVRFLVGWREKPEDGCSTLIEVADTGIGMSTEFQKRMFDPFSQEHQSRMYGTQGTGLGLSIVKKVVDLMGGHIEVQSELDKGSTFSVYLPIDEIGVGRTSAEEHRSRAEDIAGKRFLLCEDNELNAEIAETILRERGDAKVEHARDGKAGLERFGAAEPGYYDAILMDVRMPVMDGLETTRAIRTLDRPDAGTIPIVAMTADAFAEDAQNCRNAGMNAYIAKPIDPGKLIATLADLCGDGA